MDLTVLDDYGIDYKKGIKRCLDDSNLYERVLTLFLEEDILPRAEKAFASGNRRALFEVMHELKGAAGNAEMTVLFDAASQLVELLRGGEPSDAEITPLYDRVIAAYRTAGEGVSRAIGY